MVVKLVKKKIKNIRIYQYTMKKIPIKLERFYEGGDYADDDQIKIYHFNNYVDMGKGEEYYIKSELENQFIGIKIIFFYFTFIQKIKLEMMIL